MCVYNIYIYIQRYAHSYKQAMKTGKHEDKPQVLVNSSTLLRTDKKTSS